jgi:hypothetical protein
VLKLDEQRKKERAEANKRREERKAQNEELLGEDEGVTAHASVQGRKKRVQKPKDVRL